jgi:hypothetical protein
MNRRQMFSLLLFALLLLAACGGTPAAPTANIAATQTRAAELGQMATLAAPTATRPPAPTATPLTVATQTRVAELSQLATLTAPTATPLPPSATAPPAALNKGSLVGSLDASDAFIGIVVTGTEVTAYVCDGANLAQWFTGTLQGDRINLTAANGATLAAEVRRPVGGGELQAANGTFRSAEGRAANFSSAATGNLGNTSLTMGVIVLPDGRLRGVLRAGQFLLPVTDPAFAANGLTATFDEFGPVTAQRLGT